MSDSSEKMKEEILLSKRMFLAGCLGLPWLWICNALYFRLQVFGPTVMVDYWPGQTPPSSTLPGEEDDDDEGDNSGNNNSTNDDQQQQQQQSIMDQQLERQMNQKELQKWVKRSTTCALVAMSAFIAWIITFQVNKDHFGSKWFVMDETDAEKTGW
ncbi:hypothetical protein ACHAXR_010821 [Thalassiosira sp. AJA248-18]